jgi:tyrosyl-tRNA synthetase
MHMRGSTGTNKWGAECKDAAALSAAWEQKAGTIRSGAQQSMLNVLEERGFVKDVAG